MSIKAILAAAVDKPIEFLDFSDNDLEYDGARAF
jgi:hypothetical protein